MFTSLFQLRDVRVSYRKTVISFFSDPRKHNRGTGAINTIDGP